MEKLAVLSLGYLDLIRPLPFKKNLLMFDKLILVEESLEIARLLVTLSSRGRSFDDTNYIFNNQTIDFLQREGIVEVVNINKPLIEDARSYDGISPEAIGAAFLEIQKINWKAEKILQDIKLLVEKKDLIQVIPDLIVSFSSNFPRLLSLKLNFQGFDSYPLFSKELSYKNIGKKEAVLKFILNKLPEPVIMFL